MRLSIGIERNGHEIVNPRFAQAVSDLQVPDTALLWSAGTAVNPENGVWNWSSTMANWHVFADRGIKVILKRQWAPPHATNEDSISYCPYTGGSWSWKVDENGNTTERADFDPARPCVRNPGTIKAEWSVEMTRRQMDIFGTYVDEFIDWNEPGIGTYNPSIDDASGWGYEKSFDHIHANVYDPSAVYRLYNSRNARTIGPDAAYDSDFEAIIKRDAGLLIPSFHGYAPPADNTLDAALDKLATIRDITKRYDPTCSEIMNTEMSDNGAGWIIDYLVKAPQIVPELSLVNFATAKDLFKLDAATDIFLTGKPEHDDKIPFELNEVGREVVKVVQQQRRRPVTL